jgi:ribonuclease HIII
LPDDALATQRPDTHTDATGLARIGSDESGKGDFFGPLVVASVYVDQQTEPFLLKLGVRDSKKLTDKAMSLMIKEIRSHCPHSIITYQPEQYNKHYQTVPNLNILLARAHAHVINKTASKTSPRLAIVDQFGEESLVRTALREIGCTLPLEQRHRAEDDTAVAAASIIARAVFVHYLQILSEKMGIDLPKGASNPRIIEVGRTIVAQHGQDALHQIAKLHFKTTANILDKE